MKKKFVGICVCMLMLVAAVIPTLGTEKTYIVNEVADEFSPDQKSTMKVDHGEILAQDLNEQGLGYTVLRIWGSFYEMGYASAQLLGDGIVQQINLMKTYFGENYTYYRGIMEGVLYFADVEDEINGMVDSLALTHPEENIDALDIKMICDDYFCYQDFMCRSHTCWGRYVADPIKTLATRRLDIGSQCPILRHHVLCAHVPDDGSPQWVSLDTPGYVGTWSSVNEYGTLVFAHVWFPILTNLSSGRCGMALLRHVLTFATDPDVSIHLDTVYEEMQNYEVMIQSFVNYYAPEGYGGVMAVNPSMPGPDCFNLRRPNASWHHGEAMITTNLFTDGSTTPPDEDFDADEYYNNETPKTQESHWDLLEDHPPTSTIYHHMMSVAYRGYKDMTIWADGILTLTNRAPRLEYEWSDLFQPPVAEFSWTPEYPTTTLPITFDASASHDPNGIITLYEWDWDNDGIYDEAHTSPMATHTWASLGSYPVTLRVTDNQSVTGTMTKKVTIANEPPNTPTITGPAEGKPGIAYKYTITGSDPDADMVSAYITWGDNTTTDWTTFHSSGESFTVTHTWAEKGTYSVQVKVKDEHGVESGWATLPVKIPISFGITDPFLSWFFERFPHAFPILRFLMGY